MEIRKPTAKSNRIHGGETWSGLDFFFFFPGEDVGWRYLPVCSSARGPQQTSSFSAFPPLACRCHRTPALHQRGFVRLVKPINNHVTKANKDDFSPKCIKTVNRRVNKSQYPVSLTSKLVLINLMNSTVMEKNRLVCQKLNVLG